MRGGHKRQFLNYEHHSTSHHSHLCKNVISLPLGSLFTYYNFSHDLVVTVAHDLHTDPKHQLIR